MDAVRRINFQGRRTLLHHHFVNRRGTKILAGVPEFAHAAVAANTRVQNDQVVGLILVVIFLCAGTLLHSDARRVTVAGLSLVLIAGGALEMSGATANDWYLIGIRTVVQRSQPMPRPDGRVVFSSSDVNPVPVGPYVESLSAVTLAPGIRYQVADVTGPETIIVMAGEAVVDTGGKAMRLGPGQAILSQAQSPLALANPGQDTLKLLDFAVRPRPAPLAAR